MAAAKVNVCFMKFYFLRKLRMLENKQFSSFYFGVILTIFNTLTG